MLSTNVVVANPVSPSGPGSAGRQNPYEAPAVGSGGAGLTSASRAPGVAASIAASLRWLTSQPTGLTPGPSRQRRSFSGGVCTTSGRRLATSGSRYLRRLRLRFDVLDRVRVT